MSHDMNHDKNHDMSQDRRPADYLARQQALDPTRSFAVTAPAGSGKTGLLTQRVLTLLARCEAPEEVLSITFTRKAAAEMQERISDAIRMAATTQRPNAAHEQLSWDLAQQVLEQDRRKQWNLLDNPARLRILTIDGLCRALTRHNPLTSQIGGQAQMLEQPAKAYEKAVANLLLQLESESPLSRNLAQLLTDLDNNLNAISGLLVAMLARRDQWLPHLFHVRNARPYLEETLAQLCTESLSETARLLAPWASDIALLADYAGTQATEHKPGIAIGQLAGITALPDSTPENLVQWRCITDLLLTQAGSWRSARGLNVNCGFPPGKDKAEKAAAKARKDQMAELLGYLSEQPKLLSQLQLIRYLPPPTFEQSQWQLLDSLTHILPSLVAELKMVFRQLNATDFIEITQGALRAFGDDDNPTELALALDYRIQHILVDEFQDTASPQLQLLESLTRGWQPDDGRTLFIVGDGMQSCYGFRDANVGIFLNARKHGIGDVVLTPLDLTVNFRSQGGIIDWVNQTFVDAFPDSDDIARGAVSYSAAVAFHPPTTPESVSVWMFKDAPDRQAEADKVCSLVKEALAADSDKTADIAILVRSRGHLRQILPALQQAGIRWKAADIDPLSTRMAIIDLLSLTRALTSPADRIAWLALLRTPWCGLSLEDLHAIGRAITVDHGLGEATTESVPIPVRLQQPVTALSKQGARILDRCSPVLHSAWRDRRRKPLRQTIEGVWLALGGSSCLLSDSDYQDCQAYFALLDKYDQGGYISDWSEFTAAVENLYAASDSQADGRVQVMTIHKSKGLEFDTVIIPGLDKGNRADDNELLLWQEWISQRGQKRLLLSPLSPTGEDNSPIYHYLREEQKLRNQLESTRLLYVGCTRAINKLHILSNVKSDSNDALKPPPRASLLHSIWDSIQQQGHTPVDAGGSPAQTMDEEDDAATPPFAYLYRLKSDWQRPVLIPSTQLATYRGREFDDEENTPDWQLFEHRSARHTGTLVHAALQQLAENPLPESASSWITLQKPIWRARLQGHGVFGLHLQSALNTIELAIRRTLDDPDGRWVLDHDHTDSACEFELHHGKSAWLSSIIDRTFIAEGNRWIIDYKTSSPTANQQTEQFLADEVAQYSAQLHRYQLAFKARDPQTPVRLALYFPLLQHLEVVADS